MQQISWSQGRAARGLSLLLAAALAAAPSGCTVAGALIGSQTPVRYALPVRDPTTLPIGTPVIVDVAAEPAGQDAGRSRRADHSIEGRVVQTTPAGFVVDAYSGRVEVAYNRVVRAYRLHEHGNYVRRGIAVGMVGDTLLLVGFMFLLIVAAAGGNG